MIKIVKKKDIDVEKSKEPEKSEEPSESKQVNDEDSKEIASLDTPTNETEKADEIKEIVNEKEPTLEDLPGVGPTTAQKLKDVGFDTVMSIAVAPAKEISDLSGMTEAAANKAIAAARGLLHMGFISGAELLEKRTEVKKLSTGSNAFNELLGGGLETQSVTEAFGAFGSGKSQLAMQLAVNCQLPEDKGGLNGHAVFIDTENTFRPERIKQIAEAVGLNPEEALKKVMVARAYTSDHQMLLVEKVGELIKNDNIPVKIVIVDSLTSLFRSEYTGRGTLATRQQKINRHMHALQKAADMYNIIVYVTNQVQARPDIFFGNPTAAIGGHIVGHASQFRIYLRKGKAGSRIARLVDSPYLPEGEAVFKVTGEGVVEA